MKVVNGSKRGRPGTWILDFTQDGRRISRQFPTQQEANEAMAQAIRDGAGNRHNRIATGKVSGSVTLSDYAAQWLTVIATRNKPRTAEQYGDVLRVHVLPLLGPVALRDLSRERLKSFLAGKVDPKNPGSKGTVRLILAIVRSCMSSAVEDGAVRENPAKSLGRVLGLGKGRGGKALAKSKAMDREQLERCLEAARTSEDGYSRRLFPMFLLLARTGVRISEALGLKWESVDLGAATAEIVEGISKRRHGTTKTGAERTVDLSPALVEALRHHATEQKREALASGHGAPVHVFTCTAGTPYDETKVRKALKRCLKAAGLPGRFSLHTFRHSFASILLSEGTSPAYVQRALGHASITITVDTYGSWLPNANQGAVATLDAAPRLRAVRS